MKRRGIICLKIIIIKKGNGANCGYVAWGILVLQTHTYVSLEKKEVPKLFKTFPTDLPQMITS